MSDNKPSEEQAESYVKSKLLRSGFHVAKPSFDILGADLLIIDNILGKTTRFLKIQSKLRSVSILKSSHVEIPENYVDDDFVLFLYIEAGTHEELFTFFKEDLIRWPSKNGFFYKSLSVKSLSTLKEHTFSDKVIRTLYERLKSQEIKDYTSILIDGIFLEKAIRDTQTIYSEIWPEKTFVTPTLTKVIGDLLIYNQFKVPNRTVNCIIFLSEHHSLQNVVHMPRENFISDDNVEIRIIKSSEIISFLLMKQLRRIINAENVMLIADDVVYESELNELKNKGVDLIILKQRGDEGSRMYTSHSWQDIAYALGRSIGLEAYEI